MRLGGGKQKGLSPKMKVLTQRAQRRISRGAAELSGVCEEGDLSNLPKVAKSHHGKLSALSASPREEIPTQRFFRHWSGAYSMTSLNVTVLEFGFSYDSMPVARSIYFAFTLRPGRSTPPSRIYFELSGLSLSTDVTLNV